MEKGQSRESRPGQHAPTREDCTSPFLGSCSLEDGQVSPLPNRGEDAVIAEERGKWYLGTMGEQGEPEESIPGHKGTLQSSHPPP